MSLRTLFGSRTVRPFELPGRKEQVMVQRSLHRVLAFTGLSIDDVVNDPVCKRQVLGFYKLHQWVGRGMEISELERQWNRLGE